MTSREALALAVVAAPALGALLALAVPSRLTARTAVAAALVSAAAAAALTVVALARPDRPLVRPWLVVDAASGVLVGVIGLVGLASVLVSPGYLATAGKGLFRPDRRAPVFYALLFAFWALLAALPVIGNLGAAWLLVEATTAVSALLVGFSGKGRALEAGWKYLILTSLGLGVALLGIVLLAAASAHGGLDGLAWRDLGHVRAGRGTTLVAYVLLLAGLAAKAGLAPVHNWLPDAHSEAPAPVSALLSAALLPAVLLVAWRSSRALEPVLGQSTARSVLVALGLLSIGVAVPFLWRPLAWKRLLAYSSLEHMGVVALGFGFGTPLALAGVALHITGHAVAKALGFYAATPLLGHEPRAATRAVAGIGHSSPALGAVMGLSLGTLAGLPPSPLFASEALIVAGGFAAGNPWAATGGAVLLAFGFLGLAHALIETAAGEPGTHARRAAPGLRAVGMLGGCAGALLLTLTVVAAFLPGSGIAHALARGFG